MLGDLVPDLSGTSPAPSEFLDLGGASIYADYDRASYSVSLWRTDGTLAGTRLLQVLAPPGYGETHAVGVAAGRAFYSSITYWGTGTDLRVWTTDGTSDGTGFLTPRLDPYFWQAAAGGPGLFFTLCNRGGDCAFWFSNGTVAGTSRRGTIAPEGGELEPMELVALDRVALQLIRRGDRVELVAIDPVGGVTILRHFRATVEPRLLTAAGKNAFFLAPVAGRLQLWTSDGTRGGTRAVTQFTGPEAFHSTRFLDPSGRFVYFLADDGAHGIELWASDGTPGGNRRLTDFQPRDPFGDPVHRAALGHLADRIVFAADAGEGATLWTTRGTLASTQPLSGCPGGCPAAGAAYFARIGDRLVFAAWDPLHGSEPWVTDGTGPGTHLVADLTPGPDSLWLRYFTTAGRLVVFQSVIDPEEDADLWVTDGTAQGTHRLAKGGPLDFILFQQPPHLDLDVGSTGSRVVTFAFERDGRQGLWASDGNAAGTGPLSVERFGADSNPTDFAWLGDRLLMGISRWDEPADVPQELALGAGGSERLFGWPSSPPVFTGGRGVLLTYSPRDDSDPDGPTVQRIWGTDGTAAGSQPLLNDLHVYPDPPVASDRWGALFFGFAADDDNDPQLDEPVTVYRTDGTPDGTEPLLQLPPRLIPYDLAEIGGRFYFIAYEYDRDGFRVWSSDGSAEGTVPLNAASTPGYHPPHFQALGGAVYFLNLGTDGAVGLWRTNGSATSTALVAPLVDYELWNGTQGWTFEVAAGKIYYLAPALSQVIGPLLPWVSDGTPAGTHVLADLAFDDPPYVPWSRHRFVAAGGRVFFAASDGAHGSELWSTDGTTAGTVLASDVWPGPVGSDPRQLTSLGNVLAFVAQTPHSGAELRIFLPCGEVKEVADLAPGAAWSEPDELAWNSTRNVLVFAANDGIHGREPWTWTPTRLTCDESP